MDTEKYMSVEDVANCLSVSTRTIYREIQRGHLKSVKIGTSFRISKKALESYLENQKFTDFKEY